jgi:hypothetical protein
LIISVFAISSLAWRAVLLRAVELDGESLLASGIAFFRDADRVLLLTALTCPFDAETSMAEFHLRMTGV